MFDCNKLIHPFQNDPGVSQRQRIMEDLLDGPAKVDGRSLADLLNYFAELSRHVNYYDSTLSLGDWQSFFQKSLPFSVAAMSRYDQKLVTAKFELYGKLFDKKPSPQGLQLLIFYTYYGVIDKINGWYGQVRGSELPVEFAIAKLTKDQLREPVNEFIRYANCAVRWYCIRPLDLNRLRQNEIWDIADGLEPLPCETDHFKKQYTTRRQRLVAIKDKLSGLFTSFVNVTEAISDVASSTVEDSLLPLKEEFKQNHAPHLALIFAFLKLFRYLQDDLNSYTRKHLDFFYKDVLKLTAREAKPDHAHLVFEIQNALERHLLRKGLLAKDGKDNNKEDVRYSLDEEIVVNKAQVAEQRTLFLNYETVQEKTYVEGVYMAPDASKADGIKVDFKEGEPGSFTTLGAKWSKYEDPETKFIKPHPSARLGFILASPVLLLNEGTRTITIKLNCKLEPSCAAVKVPAGAGGGHCEEQDRGIEEELVYPEFASSADWYDEIASSINGRYYYFNHDVIADAVKKGLSTGLADKLIQIFLTARRKQCYCPVETGRYEVAIPEAAINVDNAFNQDELDLIDSFFAQRKAIRTWYTGEREWLEPDSPSTLSISPAVLPATGEFDITITSVFKPDRPAIAFYNPKALGEDFNTTLPLVRIELDDTLKILEEVVPSERTCCLVQRESGQEHEISLYHFFRDVKLNTSVIEVEVCGLRNLVVQNDDSVQDVNSPIFPFGTRPRVGASFYVGSKEVFSKDWREIYVNAEWKDEPKDFGVYYEHYGYKNTTFEDGSKEIVNSSFLTSAYILDKGLWRPGGQRRLFKVIAGEQGRTKPLPPGFPPVPATPEVPAPFCMHGQLPNHVDAYDYGNGSFAGLSPYERRPDLLSPIAPYNVSSQYGFLRFTLDGVSFQHNIFPFVLARHMMAYAGLLSLDVIQELVSKAAQAKKIIDAMIPKINSINLHVGHIQGDVGNISTRLVNLAPELVSLLDRLNDAVGHLPGNPAQAFVDVNQALVHFANINTAITNLGADRNGIQSELDLIAPLLTSNPGGPFNPDNAVSYGVIRLAVELKGLIDFFVENLEVDPELKDGLPNEPYTPVIKTLSLDYMAVAESTDIDLIHLYPYKDTYKFEEITLKPPLLPTFCDEGTLFLGLKNFKPGSSLNLLFQLAEATADSEEERKDVNWFYLDSNRWKLLRKGFEVIDDASNGLTASGIIRFALPANMTSDNTIMPKGLHWIKAAIPENSRSVSETIGIHAQAVRVTFTNEERNDKQRLSQPLPKDSISKLYEADAAVKKVSQPYESFAGQVPEGSSHFYVRVSELLRHKGRAIQRFDYERLVLEMFPQVYVAKCINHSFALNAHEYFNDFPLAPGYVILAVIPDLVQLKAAQSFEPRVPVSMLEDITRFLKGKTSPFVRLRVMNPRYEKVYFGLKVKLYLGKDETYYKEKLIQELREFLAPWAIGEYDKLAFGQCIYRSDIVRFLESRDYLDYIIELKMEHEQEVLSRPEPQRCPEDELRVCPLTPRSILVAGEIDVCVVQQDCETWGEGTCDKPKIRLIDYCNESNF